MVGTFGNSAAGSYIDLRGFRSHDEPELLVVFNDLRGHFLGRQHPRLALPVCVDGAGAALRRILAEYRQQRTLPRYGQVDVWVYRILDLCCLCPVLPVLVRQHARRNDLLLGPPGRILEYDVDLTADLLFRGAVYSFIAQGK